MFNNWMSYFLPGLAFGGALEFSKVYLPKVIIAQMKLQDFHMMRVFITASGAGAILILILEYLGRFKRSAKPAASFGLVSKFEANVLGGAMVGIGMAVTGACPGTVIVQVAAGISNTMSTLMGALFGSWLHAYSGISSLAPCNIDDSLTTLDAKAKLPFSVVALMYGLCSAAVVSILPQQQIGYSSGVFSITGGIAIAFAQLLTMELTTRPIGVSSAYQEVTTNFLALFSSDKGDSNVNLWQWRSYKSTIFASGIFVGSYIALQLEDQSSITLSDVSTSSIGNFLGGAIMVLGARIAGGCTSGHGISGLSQMAVSSFFTVASMFTAGILAGQILS